MKNLLLIVSLILLLCTCKKDKNKPDIEQEPPTPASLVFPYENSECNKGTNVTANESAVLFEWTAGENTDEYQLIVANLNSSVVNTYTSTETTMSIILSRNTPFTWYVLSISHTPEDTAYSVEWSFFNAGDGIQSHPPFPADLTSPAFAETIVNTSGRISLIWNGVDIDNNIAGYDVYFGTASSPVLLQSNILQSRLDNVSVSPNTVYYWRVVTHDSEGNSSDSGISQFKII